MDTEVPHVGIGFVILSHEGGNKLQRLIDVLDREYEMPPISIHHDFGQSVLDRSRFRAGIHWVEEWASTGWAKWSVVEGALKAFRLLYERTDAEWFFLLSTSDYPVCNGKKTREELAATKVDAFVDARSLIDGMKGAAEFFGHPNEKLHHFDSVSNQKIKRRFYCAPQWWLPIIRFKPRLRLGKLTYRPPFDGHHPFRNGITCLYGDHWFTANRKAVMALLDPSPLNVALQRHYRNRTQSDESYYATLLGNTKGLKICLDNRRFAEWNGGGAHPMDLTTAEIPAVIASNAFFARKLGNTPAPITLIDDHLTNPRSGF
jgi:hypothetical protein